MRLRHLFHKVTCFSSARECKRKAFACFVLACVVRSVSCVVHLVAFSVIRTGHNCFGAVLYPITLADTASPPHRTSARGMLPSAEDFLIAGLVWLFGCRLHVWPFVAWLSDMTDKVVHRMTRGCMVSGTRLLGAR